MTFRAKLLNGELLLGTLITLPSPEMVEVMVEAGFDWLFIDCEHGAFEAESAQALLQAAGDRCPCVMRVPAGDEVWIKKALDIGVDGIIVPQVNSAAHARDIISCCKYPPMGRRGVGLSRAHRYGPGFEDYVRTANERIAVILQAEHIDAVRCIDEIVRVPGVDCIFIGPYDLSASMGKLGQTEDAEVIEAIGRVRTSCRRAGLPMGYFGVSADAVRPYVAQGYSLIASGVDVVFAGNAAGQTLADIRACAGG